MNKELLNYKRNLLIDKELPVGAKVRRKNMEPKEEGIVVSHDSRDIFALIKWTEDFTNWSPVYMLEIIKD